MPDDEAPLIDILEYALLIASPYALGRLRQIEHGEKGHTPEEINAVRFDVSEIEMALQRARNRKR